MCFTQGGAVYVQVFTVTLMYTLIKKFSILDNLSKFYIAAIQRIVELTGESVFLISSLGKASAKSHRIKTKYCLFGYRSEI